MSDKPMIFSGEMVRALLDGRKTQTRRVIKPQPPEGWRLVGLYAPGDHLWVRETWALVPYTAYLHSDGVQMTAHGGTHEAAIYKAGFDRAAGGIRWRSPIHMPRWASRITLHITGVRVQRVQEISEGDAFLEGIPQRVIATCRDDYRVLWDSLNAKRGFGWHTNPWVVALDFTVAHRNIDAVSG